MPAYDPIDLMSRKQVFFRENQPDFFDNVYFWMIIDQKNDIISCSSVEFLDSILSSIKLDDNFCNSDFSSTELVKINFYSVVIPVDVYSFRVPVNGNEFILKVYIKNISLKISFRFFCMDFFNRIDKKGNLLNFSDAVDKLKSINPLDVLTPKEWVITWLLINRHTNAEIAKVTNNKVNTVNKSVDRILGPKKLAIFDRYMLSDIGYYLDWDRFIPAFIISDISKSNINGLIRSKII